MSKTDFKSFETLSMQKENEMAFAFSLIAQKAEPKLAEALAAHGVKSPDELPPEVARKIFKDVLIATAGQSFPEASLDMLKHGMEAFAHPLFGLALSRVRSVLVSTSDAFAMASGSDAAIVLAGFGLPVAPFDRKSPRVLAEPSNDIDIVASNFEKWKTAFVGYSPCDIPFYMLMTDCVQTMPSQIQNAPQLREAKGLLERAGMELPKGPFAPFKHGIVLIPRELGDSISTVFLDNPSPHQGAICLYAGWSVNGERDGAPNNGFLPVPIQFLEAALKDPEIASWLWRPTGIRVTIN